MLALIKCDECNRVWVGDAVTENDRNYPDPADRSLGPELGVNQRWREGRSSFIPSTQIDTRIHEVAPVTGDLTAKSFVLQHHYSGTYPAARFRFGLYRATSLVGVAVFSHPCNDKVITSTFGCKPLEAVELGRFLEAK